MVERALRFPPAALPGASLCVLWLLLGCRAPPAALVALETSGTAEVCLPAPSHGPAAVRPIFERAPASEPWAAFLARASGHTLGFSPDGVTVSLGSQRCEAGVCTTRVDALRMRLARSRAAPLIEALDPLGPRVHRLRGRDRTRWEQDVPAFGRLAYRDVYPGTDLVFRSAGAQLEFDFVLQPGADPEQIEMVFEGAVRPQMRAGDLVLQSAADSLVLRAPRAFELAHGRCRELAANYRLLGSERVGFELARHDPEAALVIDPLLDYSTFLGGGGADHAGGVAQDAAGYVYVASMGVPVLGFPTTEGAFETEHQGETDVSVTKFDPATGTLVYSTILGGSGFDFESIDLVVDDSGRAHLTGFTTSTDFPTTPGSFQPASGGGTDVFVTRLAADGSDLDWSTYLGGSASEVGQEIAIDPAGDVYLTGWTYSSDFPTTAGAFQETSGGDGDAFVARIDAAGATLSYSTYVGGENDDSAKSLELMDDGSVWVVGSTRSSNFPLTPDAVGEAVGGEQAFAAQLAADGGALLYSTGLGGSGDEAGRDIAVSDAGLVVVFGNTLSGDLAATTGGFQSSPGGGMDAFLAALDPAAGELVWASYLGGGSYDVARAIEIDANGIVVVGGTDSHDFPISAGAFQSIHGGEEDAFLARISLDGGELLYSTFLGGTTADRARNLVLEGDGAWLVGWTTSSDFPTADALQPDFIGGAAGGCLFPLDLMPPLYGEVACDGFVARLLTTPVVVDLQSDADTLAPGELVNLTIDLENPSAGPQDIVLVLEVEVLPVGVVIPIGSPALVLAPGAELSFDPVLQIPLGAPLGDWIFRVSIRTPPGAVLSEAEAVVAVQ